MSQADIEASRTVGFVFMAVAAVLGIAIKSIVFKNKKKG